MRNWLSSELSRKFGMFTNEEHFVRLFINKRYFGVYTRKWRFDESLLINTGRLPGPFFRFESGTGPVFKRTSLNRKNPAHWEIKGVEPEKGRLMLKNFSEVMELEREKLSPDAFKRIDEFMDREEYAKYLAVYSHSGSTNNSNHNIIFWLDTTTGKMVPFITDTVGYNMLKNYRRNDLDTSIIQSFPYSNWLEDPKNLALYTNRLFELITTFGSGIESEKILRSKLEEIKQDVMADIYVSEQGSSNDTNTRTFFPITSIEDDIEKIINFIYKRNERIRSQLLSDRISVKDYGNGSFLLMIKGYSGVIAERKDGEVFKVSGHESTLHKKQAALFPTFVTLPRAESLGFYRLSGNSGDYIFKHRLYEKISLEPEGIEKFIKFFKEPVKLSPWLFKNSNTEPLSLGPGDLVFEDTKEFEVGQKITVKAGTNIFLGPGASLIFKGPLAIQGTKNNIVKIRSMDSDKPFGVVALMGEETRGSVISHLDIEGGAVYQRFNLFFSGMFSVHDCPAIKIQSSRFGKNHIGDDSVHIVRSKIEVNNSIFENAVNDAMDLDLVNGKITNSIFRDAGNDGLDLSMGSVEISNSRFERSNDKCISVGEGSIVDINNVYFSECKTGIAVKDRSQVMMKRAQFLRCGIGWNSYMKKWRWGAAGKGWITDTQFKDSYNFDIAGDKKSMLNFLNGVPKHIRVDGKIKITAEPSIKFPGLMNNET